MVEDRERYPVLARQHSSTHWLNDNGKYRQFVANHVNKMMSQENVLWRHVTISDNPADLGSRGGSITTAELWWNGPP